MKIALGTVQWGLEYGISNKKGIPSNDELDQILSLASVSGINLLDTASSYGNAEMRIGNQSGGKFKIVTKIDSIRNGYSIEQQLKISLDNLKLTSVYGCLFHNVIELLNDTEKWEQILIQKEEGLIKKIGVSLYCPEELERLLALKIVPDLIQIPFNIIDRRFEPYFKKLNELDIEIHVRSIFLQGLLLNSKMMNHSKFSKWKLIWDKYKEWLNKKGLSPLEGCMGHALSYEEISNVIIGVEHASQLKQIILASGKKSIEAPKMLISTDQKLINPISWL